MIGSSLMFDTGVAKKLSLDLAVMVEILSNHAYWQPNKEREIAAWIDFNHLYLTSFLSFWELKKISSLLKQLKKLGYIELSVKGDDGYFILLKEKFRELL